MGKKKNIGPSRHSRGVRANEVTEIFLDELQQQEALLRGKHRWVTPALNAFSTGETVDLRTVRPFSGLSQMDVALLTDSASRAGIYRMWAREGRVTYDLNPYLTEELYRSTYDRLPGNLFSHFPHINPLVVLPDPWPVSLGRHEGLVRGFFTYGFNHSRHPNFFQQTLTTREDLEGIGILLVIDLIDLDTGEVRDQTHMTLSVPVGLKEFTLNQAVDFAADRVEVNYANSDEAEVLSLLETALKPALSILVYMCCDNRDAVEPPVVKNTVGRRGKHTPRNRDPFWVEVGWRMGPRLHAARRLAGRVTGGPETPSGIQRAAHQRVGHFHKFRVGPGRPNERTQLITNWLAPIWVGLDDLPEGVDPITTVVSVDPQRHDPLRRRGLKPRHV